MKRIGGFTSGVIAAALTLIACSSQRGSVGSGAGAANAPVHAGSLGGAPTNSGTVGAHLMIGTGVNVTSLSWTIAGVGANANDYSGTVNIGDAQSVEWVAGGIQAGTYTVSVGGVDSSGDPCTGSSTPFTVTAGATVQVVLAVSCYEPADACCVGPSINTGSVEVDASVSLGTTPPVQCPGITSLSINPAEQTEGAPAQVNLRTTVPTPAITWTVTPSNAGFFSDNSASPTFTCVDHSANPLTVTATLSLPSTNLCNGQAFTTLSAFFNCEGSSFPCSQLNPATPNVCMSADGGSACTNFLTDNNNCGSCGHVCPFGATCLEGTCDPVVVPCTGFSGGANTPPGCVTCPASPNGVCTATEQVIIDHDILKNGQSHGAPKTTSCYSCLVLNACLDSSGAAFPAGNGSGTPVTNSECGDPNGAGLNPPFDNRNASTSNPANCLSALACALTSNGANPPTECSLSQVPASVSNCYCGAATGSSCLSSPAAPIGVCASIVDTDIGLTDPTSVLANFVDRAFSPGGVGLAILDCGLSARAPPPAAANCPTCFN